MAALAIPDNEPEKVSAEMEQRLDLRGKWEGKLTNSMEAGIMTTVDSTSFVIHLDRGDFTLPWKIEDEGKGRLRMKYHGARYLGIYCQEGDRLVICFGSPNGARAICFSTEHNQDLFILHRVKPGK